MTRPVSPSSHGHQNNVRVVPLDADQQPSYLKRASKLETSLATAAARLGMEPDDMPGLHGLCLQAVRSAEDRSR